jgi:hypothetical protein
VSRASTTVGATAQLQSTAHIRGAITTCNPHCSAVVPGYVTHCHTNRRPWHNSIMYTLANAIARRARAGAISAPAHWHLQSRAVSALCSQVMSVDGHGALPVRKCFLCNLQPYPKSPKQVITWCDGTARLTNNRHEGPEVCVKQRKNGKFSWKNVLDYSFLACQKCISAALDTGALLGAGFHDRVSQLVAAQTEASRKRPGTPAGVPRPVSVVTVRHTLPPVCTRVSRRPTAPGTS